MNRFEVFKAEKDGLDVWFDIVRYAAARTPVEEIPEDDLQRMKWYGVFHRPQKPGTFMMRLRIRAGQLSAVQVAAIADVSDEFGGGTVDLTTRQAVQLRDLSLPDIPAILARLQACGLGAMQTGLDNMRNYVGCPVAGLDGSELVDATPVLRALATAHLGDRAYSNLPRKFNVSVSGCRDDCAEAETHDLSLVPATARIDGRAVTGFNVLAGGALGGSNPRLATPMDVFVQPHEAVGLVLAVLRVFRDHGPREVRTKSRLKWLLAEWGEERFRDEVQREARFPLRGAGRDERTGPAKDHVGVHRQRQVGLSYIGLNVPVGRMTGAQLREAGALAARYGSGELRVTGGQNLILTSIADERVADLMAEPLLAELSPAPSALRRGLVACTGTDYCHYSLIDTKTRALALVDELETRGFSVAPGHRLHVSGCIHACGKHHVADIGLQGATVRVDGQVIEAADIFVGGRAGPGGTRLAQRTGERIRLDELAGHLIALHDQPSLPAAVAAG